MVCEYFICIRPVQKDDFLCCEIQPAAMIQEESDGGYSCATPYTKSDKLISQFQIDCQSATKVVGAIGLSHSKKISCSEPVLARMPSRS